MSEQIRTELSAILPQIMTRETYRRLQKQLEATQKELPVSGKAISEAHNSNGGWNGTMEIEEGQRAQAQNKDNLRRLSELTAKVKFIEPRTETEDIGIGNAITVLFDGDDEPEQLTLLGPNDSGTHKSWISHESPLGAALLGKRAGQTVHYEVKERALSARIVSIQPGEFE